MDKSSRKRTLNARYENQGGIKSVCLRWYYGSETDPAHTYQQIAELIRKETGMSVPVGTLGRWMQGWINEDIAGKDRTHEHANA